MVLQQSISNTDRQRRFPWAVLGLPVFVLFFLWSGRIIRSWEMTASVPDVGTLAFLPLALFSGLSFYGLALVLCRQFIPAHGRPGTFIDLSTFKQLSPWQQCIFYTVTYFLFFFGFILILTGFL